MADTRQGGALAAARAFTGLATALLSQEIALEATGPDARQAQLVRMLRLHGPSELAPLAARAGVSPTQARILLARDVEAGLVTVYRETRSRLGGTYVYALTPSEIGRA